MNYVYAVDQFDLDLIQDMRRHELQEDLLEHYPGMYSTLEHALGVAAALREEVEREWAESVEDEPEDERPAFPGWDEERPGSPGEQILWSVRDTGAMEGQLVRVTRLALDEEDEEEEDT